MGREGLGEIQVEVILKRRLGSLGVLEEIEWGRDVDDLKKKEANLDDLRENFGRKWLKIAEKLGATAGRLAKITRGVAAAPFLQK